MNAGADSIVCLGVGSLSVNPDRVSRQRALSIAAHRALWSGMYSMATAFQDKFHLKLRRAKKDMSLNVYCEHVDSQFGH